MAIDKLNIQPKVDNAAKKKMVTSNEIGTNETLLANEVNAIVKKVNEVVEVANNFQAIDGFNFKENKATYSQLAGIVNPQKNDAYGVLSDGLVYIFNGISFPTSGNGLDLRLKPTGTVAEGIVEAVSGGEVFEYINGSAVIPVFSTTDGFALTSGGSLSTSANHETTDFIPISGFGSTVTVTTGMSLSFANRIIGYDKNKIFSTIISGSGSDLLNFSFVKPSNCEFIKVCNLKIKGIPISVEILKDTISDINNSISTLNNKVDEYNLPKTVVNGKYISATGVENTNAGFEYSYFNVVPFEKLKISSGTTAGAYSTIIYIDRFNAVISSHANISLNYVEVVIPEGCYKIAVNNYKPSNYILNVGRLPISFSASATNDNILGKSKDFEDFNKFYRLASGVPSYNIDNEVVGIIVAGQSNTDGRVPNADFPANYSKSIPNCKFNLNNRLGSFVNFNMTGSWAYDSIVYNKISEKLSGQDFYVCKRSVGATSVMYRYSSSFNADIKLFENNPGWVSQIYELELAIKNALISNPNIKFKAILWHQGEADGSANNPYYYRDLSRVIMYIRGIVKNPNLPFIYGTIPTNSTEFSIKIYEDFVKISKTINNVHMIDMGSVGMLPDGVHFNAETSITLGEQMFAIMEANTMLRRKV